MAAPRWDSAADPGGAREPDLAHEATKGGSPLPAVSMGGTFIRSPMGVKSPNGRLYGEVLAFLLWGSKRVRATPGR